MVSSNVRVDDLVWPTGFFFRTLSLVSLSHGSCRKFALLEAERWLEFHHQSGRHFRLRIPKEGRALAYHESSCDLLVAASGTEV